MGIFLCEENFQNAKQKISFLLKYLFENEIMTNLFQPSVPLLYPLKTSENLIGFLTFSGGIATENWAEINLPWCFEETYYWQVVWFVINLKVLMLLWLYFFMIPRITPNMDHHHTNKTLLENKIGKCKLIFMLFRWWCCSCMA